HVRDGQGLVLWRNAGFASGIISGRRSRILKQRAKELGINFLFQGVKDKVQVFEQILTRGNFLANEVAYIGDDVGDIDLIKRVGFSAAVADAVYDVKSLVDFVTRERGGFGAVREVIDFIFFAKKNEEESKT
ncbi:MAG: HAD hydrolase family protein, partial [Pyrinomonadaceae bacterium]|nr:HAD hydrolase family protein [Pyrinomonadaceae bacterium]